MLTFTGDWGDGLHKIHEFMKKEKTLTFKMVFWTTRFMKIRK